MIPERLKDRIAFFELPVDDIIIFIYYDKSERESEKVLVEGARQKGPLSLIGPYSMRVDNPHFPADKKHIHLFYKQRTLLSINADGKAHHSSDRDKKIPNKAYDAIKTKCPWMQLPPNGILESASWNEIGLIELTEEDKRLIKDLCDYLIR